MVSPGVLFICALAHCVQSFNIRAHLRNSLPSALQPTIQHLDVPSEDKTTDDSFAPVLAIIESLSRRSGCFNKATRELVADCADLSADANEALKGRYAIALTLCELSIAGLIGPSQCQTIRSEEETARCILALEAKPQWSEPQVSIAFMLKWTGGQVSPDIFEMYAVRIRALNPALNLQISTMCHVATRDSEADRTLNLHRQLTETSRALVKILQEEFDKASQAAKKRAASQTAEQDFLKQNEELSRLAMLNLEDRQLLLVDRLARLNTDMDDVKLSTVAIIQQLTQFSDQSMSFLHQVPELTTPLIPADNIQKQANVFSEMHQHYSDLVAALLQTSDVSAKNIKEQLNELANQIDDIDAIPRQLHQIHMAIASLLDVELPLLKDTIRSASHDSDSLLIRTRESLEVRSNSRA